MVFIAVGINASAPAMADEGRLSGEITVELQNESAVDADDPDEARHNTFLNFEADVEWRLSDSLSIEGTALLEPVRDFEPGKDTWFEEEGVFIEELLLSYEDGPWEAVAGKISPDYRDSREQERGIWTEDFSKEYEIVEKIGVGVGYTLDAGRMGAYTLGVAAFSNDFTSLAESIGTEMESTCHGDIDLSSSSVLFEGELSAGASTPYYRVGYRQIDACDPEEENESGILAALGNVLVFSPAKRVETDLQTEFGYVEDFEGSGENRRYYSVSSVTTIDRHWSVSIGYTRRLNTVDGDPDTVDYLFQLSAGYRSENGLRLEAGWLDFEEYGFESHLLGALLCYRSVF